MAAFLSTQFDFIVFFYGLSFILLGAFSLTTARSSKVHSWWNLSLFAVLQGLNEWLTFIAFMISDTNSFAEVRLVLMTISYGLLVEFARQEALRLRVRMPGGWIYFAYAAMVLIGGGLYGINTADALSHYFIGTVGAGATAFVFVWYASRFEGVQKLFAYIAAVGFVSYAVIVGLSVPAAPMWPASEINREWFAITTGLPPQFVGGLIISVIAFCVWAIWGQRLSMEISSNQYAGRFHREILWSLAMIPAALLCGWALTENMGATYRNSVEMGTRGELDLLASRIRGETTSIEGMVQVIAGAPDIPRLIRGEDQSDGMRLLDLAVDATGAELGYVIDPAGRIVAASGGHKDMLTSMHDVAAAHVHKKTMSGAPAHGFVFDAESRNPDYYASYPIRNERNEVISAAVLKKSLAGLRQDLHSYDKQFFLVDPDGIVVLTNNPDMQFRRMWPSTEPFRTAEDAATLQDQPALEKEVIGGSWETLNGERGYIERRFLGDTRWSIVIVEPVQEVLPSRTLGIAITLVITIGTLFYVLARGRSIADSIEMAKRLELQELATELNIRAISDSLTGLNNRRRFDEMLTVEVLRAQRYATPLSLVLFDIDHFKKINDNFGHLTGDRVLVQLSDFLVNRVPNSDLLARWGGEEFSLLLPGYNAQMARNLVENLRDMISDYNFEGPGRVTCSFGVSELNSEMTVEQFVARADAALYLAKQNGRNRIEMDPCSDDTLISVDTAA